MPNRDRRRRIVRIGPLALLLALPGCTFDGGGTVDTGPDVLDDSDAGEPDLVSDAGIQPSMLDGGRTAPDASSTPPEFGAACFNDLDDDGDGAADCSDPSCGATPFCCVGSASELCCSDPGTSLTVDFEDCAGLDPRRCTVGDPAPETTPWFGTPRPLLREGALIPNGDEFGDSGLVLGPNVDPTRERVVMTATIAAPAEGCADCADVLALGLAERPVDDSVRVAPDVAALVRGARGDYALVVSGEVVGTRPLTDSDPHTYTLSISPDGQVALTGPGGEPIVAATPLAADRAPMLWGRTFGPVGAEVTRATAAGVATYRCDIPSAMTREPSAVIPFEGVTWGSRVASSPSAVADGDDTLVAFGLDDRDIHLARRTAAGRWSLGGSARVESPVLVPPGEERYADPELVREADRFVLYLTHVAAAGRPTIARAVGTEGHGESFSFPTDVTLPAELDWADGPSVVDDGATRYLAVRTLRDGVSHIVLLRATSPEGDDFAYAGGTLDASIIVSPGDDVARFDHDEVADPELVLDGAGLMRLFYAGRRGTRWSVGLRITGDRVNWREPSEAPVLLGSGTGHDALWVRDPSASVRDGVLDLYYTASDGVSVDIGHAVGATP